ncbi:MAG: Hsp20/alpha crystallin family protein [Candidatus Magnetomorum sp.]|nr:Hsp20/alpha crystallin family protein [Candidatus Magnetomorum sp.]
MFETMPWKKSKPSVSNRDNSVDLFRKQADSLLNRFFDRSDWGESLQPRVDVIEKKKTFEIKAEIPGIDVDDLDISLNGHFLTISGTKKHESESSKDNYYHMERSYGSFSRTIHLPAEVEESDVDASYKKGVLNIELKKAKSGKSKRIEIKSN